MGPPDQTQRPLRSPDSLSGVRGRVRKTFERPIDQHVGDRYAAAGGLGGQVGAPIGVIFPHEAAPREKDLPARRRTVEVQFARDRLDFVARRRRLRRFGCLRIGRPGGRALPEIGKAGVAAASRIGRAALASGLAIGSLAVEATLAPDRWSAERRRSNVTVSRISAESQTPTSPIMRRARPSTRAGRRHPDRPRRCDCGPPIWLHTALRPRAARSFRRTRPKRAARGRRRPSPRPAAPPSAYDPAF